MTTIWDPLRRKDVALTPEEQVRQWFIANLRDVLGVPVHMMGSEVSFEFGHKPYRADIVVFSRSGSPLAVVECKRPEVEITAEVARQAMRYNAVLDVKFIFLTNGKTTYVYGRDSSDTFVPMDHAPSFEEMLCRQ